MEIEIKRDIFYGDDFRSLNYLIQLTTHKNRYVIIVDLTQVINSDFYKRLDQIDKGYLEENFNKQIQQQSKKLGNSKAIQVASYFITSSQNGNKDFNLEEAIRFFNQPVSIILENSLNDAYFLKAIAKYFESDGEVQRHLSNGWLELENAGGCSNVENFITAKLKKYEGLPKPKKYYLRCFVLLDSDRTNPKQELNYKHINLERFLLKEDVSYHILEKRSMENYIPNDVLDEFRNSSTNPWIDAYLRLKSEQKDFFNISVGFSKKDGNGNSLKERVHLEIEVQNLYSDLSDASYNILDRALKIANFKSSFPEKFETSHNVYKDTMLERTKLQKDPNELENILKKIRVLI